MARKKPDRAPAAEKTADQPAAELQDQPQAQQAAEAEVLEPNSPPAAESPDLEPSGEGELEPAQLIDTELETLVKTPLGMRGALEALLFVSPEPLTLRRMGNVLGIKDLRILEAALTQLRHDYDEQRRGLQIQETAEGFAMATRELFGELVLRLKGRKRRPPLSPAALETLAIVAYRQPIIRAEVESIRGVESSGTIRNLIDMGLVEMVGRKDVLGRPPLYGTTGSFLQAFGLKDLQELPAIAELKREYLEQRRREEDEAAREAREHEASPDPDDLDRQKAEAAAQADAQADTETEAHAGQEADPDNSPAPDGEASDAPDSDEQFEDEEEFDEDDDEDWDEDDEGEEDDGDDGEDETRP